MIMSVYYEGSFSNSSNKIEHCLKCLKCVLQSELIAINFDNLTGKSKGNKLNID